MKKIKVKISPWILPLLILIAVIVVLAVLQFSRLERKEEFALEKESIQAPTKAVSETASKGAFTVQVASFKEKAKAETLSEELKKKGYQPFIVSADLGVEKGIWYRVCVGNFETVQQAKPILEQLKEVYKDSFINPTR